MRRCTGQEWLPTSHRPICRDTGAKDGDEFSRSLLTRKTSADEWAVALRNIAWSAPDDRPFLAGKMREMLGYQPWRQQPGAPCYCTDLTREEMPAALAAAERARLPKRRDLSVAATFERVGDGVKNPDAEYAVRLNRALFT